MARRRGREPDAADDLVDLGADEHAWWARSPEEPEEEPTPAAGEAAAGDDPYVVLKVAPTAGWDEIVASYRRLARLWHPDGLRDPAPGERELCDDMIRRLNVAYTELRVRRGR